MSFNMDMDELREWAAEGEEGLARIWAAYQDALDSARRGGQEPLVGTQGFAEAEDYMECASCASKPGAPLLCRSCLHNRDLISKLQREAKAVKLECRECGTLWEKKPGELALCPKCDCKDPRYNRQLYEAMAEASSKLYHRMREEPTWLMFPTEEAALKFLRLMGMSDWELKIFLEIALENQGHRCGFLGEDGSSDPPCKEPAAWALYPPDGGPGEEVYSCGDHLATMVEAEGSLVTALETSSVLEDLMETPVSLEMSSRGFGPTE